MRIRGTTSASDDGEKRDSGKEGDVADDTGNANGDSERTIRDRRVRAQKEEKS